MPRPPASRSLRILIVEDHADLCYSLKLYMGMLGHRVDMALSRADARKTLESEEYDLLVLDLVLQEDSEAASFEVPANYRGKVITMSAYADDAAELGRLLSKLTPLRHLQKPFRSEELDFAIEQSCDLSSSES